MAVATEYDAPAVLMTAFNARAWSGVSVLDRGGAAVALPTYGTIGDGRFRDATDLLHGRGQSASECLPGEIAASWTGAGTATCGIDTDGRFYIEADTTDFTISASANNAIYGFEAAGHALVGGAAPFRRTAPNPWRLGPIINASITIDPAGAGVAFTLGGSRHHQDLVTAIRELGSTDADDRNPTQNLQAIDAGIYSSSIRWLIDETGHVVTAWRTGTTTTPTWLSSTFRARLGFSGLESVASVGVVDYLRADYPLPGLVLMADGLERHLLASVSQRTVRDLSGGGVAGISTDHHVVRHLSGYLRGPSLGPGEDMHRHYVGSVQRPGWMSYVDGPQHVTLYPRWGDPRRWLDPMAVTSAQPAEDLVYTAGLDGYRGRVEGALARATQPEQRIEWDGPVRQHALVTWTLKEAT